jgi:acyl-CoA thioesterase-1
LLLRNVKFALKYLGLVLGLGQVFGLVMVFAAFAGAPKIVVLGDSLVAGYQLPPGEGFPEQLQKNLTARNIKVVITGAGVSGDTTSGGLSRLDWSVPDGTNGVILELGANDAMRGLPFEHAHKNLDAMITRLTERGIAVLLVGMRAPPNMGEDYQQGFDAIYPVLAKKHNVPLYPFFLDGVAANPALNLSDGIHPNKAGIAIMIERTMPYIERFIQQITNVK